MQQPIEQRGDGGGVAEQLAPVINRTVRCQYRGRALVAAHDDLQEIFGGRVRQFAHAEIVDDEQRDGGEIGVPTYRFVRKYVERRPPVPLTLRQVDPLIRQLTLYRDLIDRKTGDPL